MKYCEHCGGKLEGDVTYCPNCGAAVSKDDNKQVVEGQVVNNTTNSTVKDNTTLAFEYAKNIDAEITNKVDSVFNPESGTITAEEIEELIVEKDMVDPAKTKIVCNAIGKTEEIVEWRRNR